MPGKIVYGPGNATRDRENRDAYYWRLLATAASFALFGLGGLCLRLVIFPVLNCLPGDARTHRLRARQTVSGCFWILCASWPAPGC